eukprot:2364286-Ditylum_brightwellii.AAC.2
MALSCRGAMVIAEAEPALQVFCTVGVFAWVGGQRWQRLMAVQRRHGGGGGGMMMSCWCLTRHHSADCQIGGSGDSLAVASDNSNGGSSGNDG